MKNYVLDDVLCFFHGKAIKPSEGDVPIYGSNGVIGKTQKLLYDDAIIIGRVGAYCGSVERCKGGFWASDNTIVAKAKNGFSTDYCFYMLKTMPLNSFAGGSAQPLITQTTLKSLNTKLPCLQAQHRVASVLTSYDKMIENNQKQIKLLEEAAQRLYKEWFVDLRFPGYETTPFADGIPEGWVETTIGEETEVRRGGSPRPIQEYLSDEGLNWLKISDATASNSPFIYQIKEKIKSEGLKKTVFMKAGAIILSNSATPGIPKILKIDTCIHDGWLYFPDLQLSNEYMYHLFLQIRSDLVSRATGAVFTNLRTDILKGYRFVKPDDYILDLFNKQVKPIFSEIDCLHQQVLLLTEARDRLLPKLMNGEIEV